MSGLHPKSVVVPIDFSDLSREALDRGIDIAGNGAIHVIHVLTPAIAMEPGNLYGTITDETRVESTLKYFDDQFNDKKYADITSHAVVGDPGRAITELAQEVDADLIVIPSHGRGFFKHMVLGSVAERVVRLAHCPVLVLRS
jgi:nucleotide-binding universal stress UspA family protein